jgi:hypothetical protein
MKKKKHYMAVYKKGGCAVVDAAAKVPAPLYYFSYTANANENADAENAMHKIAGLMNLLEFEKLEQRMRETALGILKEYEHLKMKDDENK